MAVILLANERQQTNGCHGNCLPGPFLFESQVEMVKFMKDFHGSRFKVFADKDEAEKFSLEMNYEGQAFNQIRDNQVGG